jgi:hypothetical protein
MPPKGETASREGSLSSASIIASSASMSRKSQASGLSKRAAIRRAYLPCDASTSPPERCILKPPPSL